MGYPSLQRRSVMVNPRVGLRAQPEGQPEDFLKKSLEKPKPSLL